MIFACIIVFAIICIKYKPVYKVTIGDEQLGFISNKQEFEKLVNEEIINPSDSKIAYVDIETMPNYSLTLASVKDTNEEEIYKKIKNLSTVTYGVYAINVNGQKVSYVESKEDAEQAVEDIKQKYKKDLSKIEIMVTEEYIQDLNCIQDNQSLENTQIQVANVVKEEIKKQSATIDGVYFSVKPVSGVITSRYGSVESIRNHSHSGLDIGAPTGTTIKAAADGKVTFSGENGGYGKLIIITHENGIQSYYAHCSKLYASVGDIVEAGDKIAEVGSTGNSTGSHLHFEIRKNGSTINPQKYIYK